MSVDIETTRPCHRNPVQSTCSGQSKARHATTEKILMPLAHSLASRRKRPEELEPESLPGGEPGTGAVDVELVPPTEAAAVQTAPIVVDGDDEIPPGAARFFTAGSFEAMVAGALVAGGIEYGIRHGVSLPSSD